MAVDYTLLIQSKDLTKELLLYKLKDAGLPYVEPIVFDRGIEINQYQNIVGLSIYLIDASKPPYDACDFDFLNKEFKFKKSLRFRLNKNFEDLETVWKIMITVTFSLMSQLNTNAIFAFETDVPYCMFTEKHQLYINTQTEILKNPYFKECSKEWTCFDMVDFQKS